MWNSSKGTWAIQNFKNIQLGQPEDIPIPGDYNGDEIQPAVYRPKNNMIYIYFYENYIKELELRTDFINEPFSSKIDNKQLKKLQNNLNQLKTKLNSVKQSKIPNKDIFIYKLEQSIILNEIRLLNYYQNCIVIMI